MILASHAIIGGSLGRLFLSPLAAFFVGLLSHYIMDAIPHWEYTVRSISQKNEVGKKEVRLGSTQVFQDACRIFFDLAAGIIFTFFIFQDIHEGPTSFIPLAAGIIGGILPDGLQFLYLFIKREPLAMHQKLHNAIHAKSTFKDRPLIGIPIQIIIVIVCIIISKLAG